MTIEIDTFDSVKEIRETFKDYIRIQIDRVTIATADTIV